jgi:BNR repeat-like domain
MKPTLPMILLLFCCASAFGQTHQHGAMQTGDGSFNPFVASNNRRGFYLAYVQRANGVSNVMFRRSPAGGTFAPPIRVSEREGDGAVRNENPPKVAVSNRGDVYVCWANERARWKGNIRFARSTDEGNSFSPAVSLNSDADGEPAGHAFQSIAVDRQGRIYVVWIDERNKTQTDRGAEIWMSTSDDGGKSFTRDRRILSDVCECCRTAVQVDSTGRVFVSYRMVPGTGPMLRDVAVAVSEDRGRSFASRVVSRDQWEISGCPVAGPALCIDSSNRMTVIWFMGGGERPGLYYAFSTDGGQTFSRRRLLDPAQKLGKHASAAGWLNGKIVVTWDDVTDKPLTAWGTLDPHSGLLQKLGSDDDVTYPVGAATGDEMVVAGLRSSKEIFLKAGSLKNR